MFIALRTTNHSIRDSYYFRETHERRKKRAIRPPTLVDALIPIISLIIFLAGAIYLYGDGATAGPTQVALLLATMIAGLIGLKNGYRWEDMGHAAAEGISTALGAIFILLAVGALVGTWMMSGTIATLVHLGVQFLSATWYYVACVIICALLALSIGSSWTVVGTIGIGLIAIAEALGVSTEITAGAVISGAYFGDKMSPLSETTNLSFSCGRHGFVYPYQGHDMDGCPLNPYCPRHFWHYRPEHGTPGAAGSYRSIGGA